MIPDAGRIILIDVSAEGFAFESNHPKETWTKGAAIAASFTFGGDVFEVKGVIVHAAKHPATSRWRYGVDLAGIRGVPAKKMSELVMELQRRELLRHRGTGD
jgi:hypothetical protein